MGLKIKGVNVKEAVYNWTATSKDLYTDKKSHLIELFLY